MSTRCPGGAPSRYGLADELIDPPRDVARAAFTDPEEAEASALPGSAEIAFEGLAGDFGDRRGASPGLEAKAGIELVRDHDGRPLHAYSIPHHVAQTLRRPDAHGLIAPSAAAVRLAADRGAAARDGRLP